MPLPTSSPVHRAAQLRQVLEDDAPTYGYQLDGLNGFATDGVEHDWPTLVSAVQQHVKSLNFGYRTALSDAGVTYVNARGTLAGGHTVHLAPSSPKQPARTVSARHIVLAVGGRPRVPASLARAAVGGGRVITSDDLFSLKEPPGRTLVIGGGYVALECAGFLASLGFDVTVLLRSVPLRGFDRECAERVLASVEAEGATIVRGAEPVDAEATADGRTAVRWSLQPASTAPATAPTAAQPKHVFDTVLVATGRDTECAALHLEAVGLSTDPHGKLPTTFETSAVDFIHAVGDMASEAPHGRPELTPIAIRSGVLLARRLCGDPEHGISCADPNLAALAISGVARAGLEPAAVPTAVFTPSEYACVGLSEEAARTALGDANLEVYLSEATPLEHAPVDGRSGQRLFVKLLCDKAREERLVGVHVVGEGAAEIVPGYARKALGRPSGGPRKALGRPSEGPHSKGH